jgi:hypothetical protein
MTAFPIVCNHPSSSLHPGLEDILGLFESEVTPGFENRSDNFFRVLSVLILCHSSGGSEGLKVTGLISGESAGWSARINPFENLFSMIFAPF